MSYEERALNGCIGPIAPTWCLPAVRSSRRSGAPSLRARPHRRPWSPRGHPHADDGSDRMWSQGRITERVPRLQPDMPRLMDQVPARRTEDAGQDRAQALAILDPVARTPAQRSVCRAGQAGRLSLARGLQAARDRPALSHPEARPAHPRPRRGAGRLVADRGARRSASRPARARSSASIFCRSTHSPA